MLARTYGPRYSPFPCFLQPKLNGVRALYQNGTFQSRDEKLWKPGVLQHLVDELLYTIPNDIILDGELYVHGWRLQRINGAVAVNRLSKIDDTTKVEFHVFDTVSLEKPFSKRFPSSFQQLLIDRDLPHVRVVPTAFIGDTLELDSHFFHWTSLGYEGVMLRPDGLPYEFGTHEGRNGSTQYRSKSLWKYKSWMDAEFECVGTTVGEGKADIGIGALILQAPSRGIMLPFRVGTGFDDKERVEFAENSPLGKQVKVRFLCLSADGIPLNPSFLSVM